MTKKPNITLQELDIVLQRTKCSKEMKLNHIRAEAYSEPFQTNKIEPFAKIVNRLQPLIILAKKSIYMFDRILNVPLPHFRHELLASIYKR